MVTNLENLYSATIATILHPSHFFSAINGFICPVLSSSLSQVPWVPEPRKAIFFWLWYPWYFPSYTGTPHPGLNKSMWYERCLFLDVDRYLIDVERVPSSVAAVSLLYPFDVFGIGYRPGSGGWPTDC